MGGLTIKINVSILSPVATLLRENPKRLPFGQIFKRAEWEHKNFRLITSVAYPDKDEVVLLIEEVTSKKFSTNLLSLTLDVMLPHEELEETIQILETTKKEQEHIGEHNHTEDDKVIRLSVAELINRRHLVSDITIIKSDIALDNPISTYNIIAILECDPTEMVTLDNSNLVLWDMWGTGKLLDPDTNDYKKEYQPLVENENGEMINIANELPKEIRGELKDFVIRYASYGYVLDEVWGLMEDAVDKYPNIPPIDIINYLMGEITNIDREYRITRMKEKTTMKSRW